MGWKAEVHVGIVVSDSDPERRWRIQVYAPGLYEQSFWVPALFNGAAAVPNTGEAVLLLEHASNQYRWVGRVLLGTEDIPTWVDDEYPDRRALPARNGATLVGIDAAGLIYCGHFAATEAAVLGTTLKAKLDELYTQVANLGTSTLAAIAEVTAAIGVPLAPAPGTNTQAIANAVAAITTLQGTLAQVLSSLVKVAKDTEA